MELMEVEKRIREADCQALMDYKSGKGPAPELYKPFGFLKAAEDDKPMVFVASEESEDRIGDVITAAGWQLEEFQKNPVYMFAHDYSIAPIGIVPKIWVEGKHLLNLVEWDPADELAQFIKGKYQRKIMRAESVGFRPIDWEEGEKGFLFKSQELLEISAVPVPMHPHALAKAMHKGKFTIIVPELAKVIEPVELKPFPNEHACRLRDPGDFQDDSFRRSTRKHEGKEYSIIMGRLQGETSMTEQSYRYAKDAWDAGDARSHCESHDGSFEAASEEAMKLSITKAEVMEMAQECKGHLQKAMDTLDKMMAGEEAGKFLDVESVRAAIIKLRQI